MAHDFQDDLDAVGSLDVVPTIFEVIRLITGMGFIAIARVTESRWVTCQALDNIGFGLKPGDELRVETTICHEIRQSQQLVAIDHVAENKIWVGHHTPLIYGFQSYISVPIILADGSFFGTLCAIDPNPASVENFRVIGTFKLFADLIARHLDAREKFIETEHRLSEAVETAQLRDQFIAVLGHDIRNPIASIAAGAKILRRSVSDDQGRTVLGLMQQSVVRVANIVDNVLDFARGRLGGGIMLRPTVASLATTLETIVAELRAIHPTRTIETSFSLSDEIHVDHARIGQLFSNLLANAIVHGSPDGLIRTYASDRGGALDLWVANTGEPIPPEDLDRLFQPFKRRETHANTEGLGLGLYIAAQIAEAHDGTLIVRSSEEETRFTLRIPLLSCEEPAAAE